MNLSNPLTVLLLYFFVSNPLLLPGLVRPGFSFRSSTFQSCYSVTPAPLGNPRSVWDCKGRNLFVFVKPFLKTFFPFFLRRFQKQQLHKQTKNQNRQNLSLQHLKTLLRLHLNPPIFLRSGLQK